MKKTTFFLIVAFLFFGFQSFIIKAQKTEETKISSYTQMVIRNYEQDTLNTLQNKSHRLPALYQSTNGISYLKSFIRMKNNDEVPLLEEQGVIFETLLEGVATCLIPINKINEIATINSVTGIEAAQPVSVRLDSVRRCSNISPVYTGVMPLKQPYQGTGVIIGVVDEGFDFTHPNYYDPSGTFYRVQKVWSQTAIKGGVPPIGYTTGIEYTTQSAILGAQTDNSTKSHGTHTSGIAAGGGYETPYMGIAPMSDIILVATDMYTTGIINGIQYIMTQAKAATKPCVINLSLGSDIGPHDGTTSADLMMDQMAGAGAIIVGAAGNSGANAIHLQKSLSGASDNITSILKSTNTTNAVADIWSHTPNTPFSVQVLIYNTLQNKITHQTTIHASNTLSLNTVITTENTSYSIGFNNQLFPGNNCYNSLVVVKPTSSFVPTELVVLKVTASKPNLINIWASDATFVSNNLPGYVNGDTNYTVGEIGGVGKQVISVGAYTTKIKWTNINNEPYSYKPIPPLYQIASFSSKGPTADARIKPDITAPGFGVVSGFNSFSPSFGASNTRTILGKNFKNRTYYWGIDQGTSMACPVVTGTIALWLEANPKLTPADIKQIFSQYAQNSNIQRILMQDNTYGWGKIDAFAGIQQAIALDLKPDNVKAHSEAIVISPNPSQGAFRIKATTPFERVELTDFTGKKIVDEQLSIPQIEHQLTIETITSGIYLLIIHSKKEIFTSKVVIK